MRIRRIVSLLGVAVLATTVCHGQAAASLPRIVTHDNRTPAGTLSGGVLRINLEIRQGSWYPEAEDGPHIRVYAFAEPGKAPMVPGPLMRVAQGTRVNATVKNQLEFPIDVHGFFQRPGKDEAVTLGAGEQREFEFEAGEPGTYYYWAARPESKIAGKNQRHDEDTQLSGAFVVDGAGSVANDRVFVIGLWRHFAEAGKSGDENSEFGTINGKAWPFTEKFLFPLGESVQWRWINTTGGIHPMHLHGAYYRVDAVGNGEHDQRFATDQRPMIVTQNMAGGSTMEMNWKPDRPGHWLFHCHIVAHIVPDSSLSAIQKHPINHHGSAGMSGIVLAAEVIGPAKVKPASYRHPRRVRLFVKEIVPRKQIELELVEGRKKTKSAELMGPPIILHRGEPTEIEISNLLPEQTAIHWHGMELESQYDGVPDFSGIGKQVTPPIASGKSYVARMTPPRSGTFIYHTHWHDVDQLNEGLYGPLIVLEPGVEYRPEHDVSFVAGLTVKDTQGPLLINGVEQPVVKVRAGSVRLRLINITPNNTALFYTLTSHDKKLRWRKLAKDGMELPESQKLECESVQQVGVGETYDFEIQGTPGDEFQLEGFLPGPKNKAKAFIRVQ